jgi:endonuclease/exonuclease/phosphatase family metal-dependent hydrolase
MRPLALALVITLGLAVALDGDESCAARVERVGAASLHWIEGPEDDREVLHQWCRGVGPPFYVPQPHATTASPPALEDLVVVTWNAHLAEGRLEELVAALARGTLTGAPVRHFVLLVQELYRRGLEVPPLGPGVRSAHAIRGADDDLPDARAYAATLGLSMLYVPSMRNGAQLFEDRGNAIVSSEPLANALALELPFERQRRVALGASVQVMRDGIASTLRVVNVHLEPLSARRTLWVFRNPRTRQVGAILDMLSASRFEDDVAWAGTVLGGDLNTVKAGIDERAYRAARAWGHSTCVEDRRATHRLGRLDYLFYRLPEGWSGSAMRATDKFGSDHHPVLGRFTS